MCRWGLWLSGLLLALFALQLTVLAFPQLVVTNCVQVGTVVLYYDEASSADIETLAADVEMRLRGSGFYDSTRINRVFFFQNQNLYALYARLTMVPPGAQGFCLPVFNNSFVSAPIIAALAAGTGGLPRYSIWEGSPAHTIAHEIGHQYIVDRIGGKKISHWKREGLPEYVANIALIRQDSLASLPDRVGVLNSGQMWSATRHPERHNWDRIHYEAGLLVEFLIDVQSYTLTDIIADSVTRDETLAAMMAWVKEQNRRP
ncbi:MAG: hypothetical protein JSV44_09570 [Candidatus Zixiibacteriota bacterium]|nr:MAG: hypothetical protein JSV44_09570 [candidate division Zixibacteria bacterium]